MRRLLAALSLLVFCACATSRGVDLANAELVDLTHTYDEQTLYWPSSPPATFELKKLAYGRTPGGWFYSSYAICTPEHGGTHLDAPIHFSEGRRTIDQIPVHQLIAPAVVIDVTDKTASNADYLLTADDVRAWELRHGTIAAGTIVLLRTGWSKRWPDRLAYFGDASTTSSANLHFPSYGEDAARLLVTDRRVGALGVDTASIDYGQSKDFIVHQIANGADVPGLENIINLERVPETGAWIIALPMKIGKGSGGPVRIVAAVPR
jgi:kynurenine formamidase